MRVLWLVAVVSLIASCKHKSATDLSTPEKTLQSFFNALKESRIPDELNAFVVSPAEQTAWKLRCEARGCKKAKYEIVKVRERGESGATLILNYTVWGNDDQIVMKGTNSPISFERSGTNWGISQFGRQLSAPKKKPQPAKAADKGPADAPKKKKTAVTPDDKGQPLRTDAMVPSP